ncbi:MAG: beta-ketoacyl-ACP synthase 3, partial [Devosia sp.]
MTNDDLAKIVDTSDEWIVQRTGIRQRHIAAEGENTSDLAANAGRKALENAGLGIEDIDLIIVATTTPDMTFPATAAVVQQKLDMHHGAAFDIQAVCSGFVYAVGTADSFLKNGLARRALVIGAETASRILDWNDRTTCVLFGDGAGAVVMELAKPGEMERGVLATALRSDGHHWNKLYTDGGPSSTKSMGHVRMEG